MRLWGKFRALLFKRSSAVNYTTTLAAMDFAYQGSPFVYGPSKVSIDAKLMDIAYRGAPFVGYTK